MSSINTTSPFISYTLSSEEQLLGHQLSLLQKQCIQNIIAAYATERVQREINVSNPMETVQADAKLKGQIESLQYLLDLSDSADQVRLNLSNPAPQEG